MVRRGLIGLVAFLFLGMAQEAQAPERSPTIAPEPQERNLPVCYPLAVDPNHAVVISLCIAPFRAYKPPEPKFDVRKQPR